MIIAIIVDLIIMLVQSQLITRNIRWRYGEHHQLFKICSLNFSLYFHIFRYRVEKYLGTQVSIHINLFVYKKLTVKILSSLFLAGQEGKNFGAKYSCFFDYSRLFLFIARLWKAAPTFVPKCESLLIEKLFLMFNDKCFIFQTDCFLICYAIDSKTSFENVISKWSPEIRHFSPHVPIVLIGKNFNNFSENFFTLLPFLLMVNTFFSPIIN